MPPEDPVNTPPAGGQPDPGAGGGTPPTPPAPTPDPNAGGTPPDPNAGGQPPAGGTPPDPNAGGQTDAQKELNRLSYELRKTREQLTQIQTENAGYKRRDEEARRAQLTKEQKLEEDLKTAQEELVRVQHERLCEKIAAEYKLPPALAARLQGTDEAAIRADAQELASLVTRRLGDVRDPAREGTGNKPTFKRSQLRDRAFFVANEKEIRLALQEGRITED